MFVQRSQLPALSPVPIATRPPCSLPRWHVDTWHGSELDASGRDASEDADQSKSARPRRSSLLGYEGTVPAEDIPYVVVVPRPVSDLPPSPPDHARAPTLDEVRDLGTC